jgi:hypothetical protein
MYTTSIQVQYVNPPTNPSYKSGSVKDTQGVRYTVPVAHLPLFQPGQQYDITVEPGEYNGRPFNKVTAVNGQPLGAAPQQPGLQPVGQYVPPPPPQPAGAPQAPMPAPTPQQAPRPAQPPSQALHKADQAREIFITGVVGRAMGSGNFDAGAIGALTTAAAQAWHELQQWQPQSCAPAVPVDDEIPF